MGPGRSQFSWDAAALTPPSNFEAISSRFRGDFGMGGYGDFEMLNTQRMECTTTQNMCWRFPKHPRSCSSSTVVQRSHTKRPVQPRECHSHVTNGLTSAARRGTLFHASARSGARPTRIHTPYGPCLLRARFEGTLQYKHFGLSRAPKLLSVAPEYGSLQPECTHAA
jgi:hypothetical protein